ncbi:MAG: transglutaminase domain-containing protein [Acidobacteriota bacterium]
MLPEPSFLQPGRFVDSDHPDVIAFAADATAGARTPAERAARLFRAVRERLRYDPYSLSNDPAHYVASALLHRERAYCIPKAVLLCAAARAAGIPARLGFADVKNHLASAKLRAAMGTDLFAFHGYVELWIDGAPVKATPAFNAALCARFGVPPLELEPGRDALLQAYDGSGRRYMEYVRERGLYLDLPLDEILRAFAEVYGRRESPTVDDEVFQ